MHNEGIALVQNCEQIWAQHTLKPQKQVFVRLDMLINFFKNELSTRVLRGERGQI